MAKNAIEAIEKNVGDAGAATALTHLLTLTLLQHVKEQGVDFAGVLGRPHFRQMSADIGTRWTPPDVEFRPSIHV